MLNVTSRDTRWTTINVALSNVIHQTTHFVYLLTSVPRVQLFGAERSISRELIVPLRIASVCDVRCGEGTFMFVGRIRLKRTLHIQCAPRLEDFRRVWYSAVEQQIQPCHLPVT